VAIIFGGGQQPGEAIGNGRAMSILFAREGAKVMVVDRDFQSAKETETIIREEGGVAFAFKADITNSSDCLGVVEACINKYDRIDILVNNVGIVLPTDSEPVKLSERDWDQVLEVNLKGMFLSCKQVLPVMEKQESGSIINISSLSAVSANENRTSPLAYKTSKAGVNALTQYIALNYANKGIRVNTIMPGLMNTPIGVESTSTISGISKNEIIRTRDHLIPLKGGMGDGWDTAYAALFLASDEAKFITSVVLPVDGGQSARIG
jgi:NAD(P)-dependent dehydrogenase (short-subunit alcohol dehydrogenase family)